MATKAKSTKAKSKKPETTKSGRKKGTPIGGGSPVTIGGGAGLERGQVVIQVMPGLWKWDPDNGTLTPKEDGDKIDFISINYVAIKHSIRVREKGYGYFRNLQHLEVADIEIRL
jgi:hypothetical protein